MSDVGRLELSPGTFSGFPRTGSASFVRVGIAKMPNKSMEVLADSLLLEDSNIGIMASGIASKRDCQS